MPHQQDEAAAFEDLLAEMSRAFIRATADQIDSEIDRWLEKIGIALELDRTNAGEFNTDEEVFYNTYHWHREGVRLIPSRLKVNQALPWLASNIFADELVVIRRLDDLPPEARQDAEFARLADVKSNLTVPLKIGGFVIGAVAFGTARKEREWPPAIVKRLILVAEVIGNALERKRNVAQIRDLNQEINRISRLSIMRQLTASLAHELNQPLGAILTNAQAARRFLRAENPDLDEVRDALDEIVSDDSRAVEIIRNIRTLFRSGTSEKRESDPTKLLRDVVGILKSEAARRQIVLRLELPKNI
jgi:signal transduction histidine kinase